MPRPFSDADLDAAAGFLAERHARHRAAEPLLPMEIDFRAEVEALWRRPGASGAVSEHGFLIGAPRDNPVWGPNVWVELAGHATEQAEAARDLYALAAQRWVDEGLTRQYAHVPAHDRELVEAWFRLSFGQQHAAGIREVPEHVDWPEGVREATADDLETLIALDPLLPDHQARSPVFGRGPRETEEELRQELLEELASPDSVDLLAEVDGRHATGGARQRRRARTDAGRFRLGSLTRPRRDRHRLARDEPPLLPLLAGARLPADLPPALSLRPVSRIPLLVGTRVQVVQAPAGSIVLRPPPPAEAIADVGAAVRDALRYPLDGPPLAEIVPAGGRATIVVEPPALPIPGTELDPRRAAVDAASLELELAGVPTSQQTLLVAGGLARRLAQRDVEGLVTRDLARRFTGRVVVHDAEDPGLVELAPGLRVNRELVETDATVVVSAAQTFLNGGRSSSAPPGQRRGARRGRSRCWRRGAPGAGRSRSTWSGSSPGASP
jgi:hypothetical protein